MDRVHGIEELKGAAISYTLELDKCFVCGGVWFDKGELDKYLTEEITIVDSPALGGGLDRKLDEKKGKCPRCQIELKKTPAPQDKNMTVDMCEKCGGLWLDSTEIDRLERTTKSKAGLLELFFKGFKKPQAE